MRLVPATTGTMIWRRVGYGRPPRCRGACRWLGRALLGCGALLCPTARTEALDGLDARQFGFERQRAAAVRQLDSARQSVTAARAAVEASQRELDEFVARHFEELRSLEAEEPPVAAKNSAPFAATSTAAGGKTEQLRRQIEELTTRRDQLLERFLPAHPEVASIERQIEEYSANLAATAKSTAAGDRSPPGPDDEQVQSPEAISPLQKRRQAAARLYDDHVERLNAAKQDLREAVKLQKQAEQRVARLPSAPPTAELVGPPQSTTAIDARPPAAPAPRPVSHATGSSAQDQHGSQPLALLALVIALAVAALAAVKLARSTSDALFASVDDIAAALALPVVGIFPTADCLPIARVSPVRSFRLGVVAGQVALAAVLFALIAYIVQDPGALWQTLVHPLESAGRIVFFLRGQ